jgi:two-component system, sensor histidine kinase PdtaS
MASSAKKKPAIKSTMTLAEILQQRRADLAHSAARRLQHRGEWQPEDMERLLDLCAEEAPPALLDAIEDEGRVLAERQGRLDIQMAGLESVADALDDAIDEIFSEEDALRSGLHDLLHIAHRTDVTAIARGFQAGIEHVASAAREHSLAEQRRLHAVQHVNSLANSTMNIEDVLSRAARIIAEMLPADLCAIFLYENQSGEITLLTTSEEGDAVAGHFVAHLDDQVTGAIVKTGKPGGVSDLSSWTIPPMESQMFGRAYRSIYVVPIISFGGEIADLEGAITVLQRYPFEPTPEDVRFLELVAGQLALSITSSAIYHRAEESRLRQSADFARLQAISATVATSFDLTRVLELVISKVSQMLGALHGAIFLQDAPEDPIRIFARYGMHDAALREATVGPGGCCVRKCVELRTRVTSIDCMYNNPECYLYGHTEQLQDGHTSLAVPLISKGVARGAMHLLRPERHIQREMQEGLLETFANEAAMAIESTRLYEETVEALAMKSHLLQDMHHRVKNNLLSIAAILRMEARRASSVEVEHVLRESISRIDSMAATHDLLSYEEHIGTANFTDIVMKLVGVVKAHLAPPNLTVHFNVRSSTVVVHSRKALLMAIILNELLANAIEHGMGDRASGRVTIGAWETDGMVHIIVADDGSGPPADLDLATTTSLGLSLVHSMAHDELRGDFQLRRGPLPPEVRDEPDDADWTLAEIIFPAEHDALGGA